MFQITDIEYENLISDKVLRSQFATLENGKGKHRKYLPYVFTEQGVAMLSAVLRSQTAIQTSIQVINGLLFLYLT